MAVISVIALVAWLCAHQAKQTRAAAHGEGRGVRAGGRTGLWTWIRLSNEAVATCARCGHMCTVHVCARLHRGAGGGEAESEHTAVTCILLFPVMLTRRGGRWHEWHEQRCWLRGSLTALPLLVPFLPQSCWFPFPPLPPLGLSSFLHCPCTFWPVPFTSLCSPCAALLFCHLCWTSVPCSPASVFLWPLLHEVPAERWVKHPAALWLPLLAPLRPRDGAGQHLPSSGCGWGASGEQRGAWGVWMPQQINDSWGMRSFS